MATNETTSAHIPTPWHAGLSECPGVYGGEQHWAILGPNASGIIADVEGGLGAKSKANAEFIVRACNNHEELLTACKMSLQDAKDALSGDWEPARHGWESIVEHLWERDGRGPRFQDGEGPQWGPGMRCERRESGLGAGLDAAELA